MTVKDDDQHSYEFPLYDWLKGLNSETEPAEKQLLLYHGKRKLVKCETQNMMNPIERHALAEMTDVS